MLRDGLAPLRRFFVLHAVRISGVDDFLFAGLLELRHIERLTRLQIRKVRDARRRGLGFELAFAPRHDWRRLAEPPVPEGLGLGPFLLEDLVDLRRLVLRRLVVRRF